jgi:hypothetical protein
VLVLGLLSNVGTEIEFSDGCVLVRGLRYIYGDDMRVVYSWVRDTRDPSAQSIFCIICRVDMRK